MGRPPARMREPFLCTMLRKANNEVLPMHCRMSRRKSFMMVVPFRMWPDETNVLFPGPALPAWLTATHFAM